MKYAGHWYSQYSPEFPMPVHSDEAHPHKAQILEAYDTLLASPIFEYGSSSWDSEYVRAYRGISSCRCCKGTSRVSVGNKEYRYNGWVWPEGFRHYIDVHNIIPTEDFLKEILNIELKD